MRNRIRVLRAPGATSPVSSHDIALCSVSTTTGLGALLTSHPRCTLKQVMVPGVPIYSNTICISNSSVCPVLGSNSVMNFGSVHSFASIVCNRVCLISFRQNNSRCLTIGCIGRSRQPSYVHLIDCGGRRSPVSLPLTTIGTVTVIGFSVEGGVVV